MAAGIQAMGLRDDDRIASRVAVVQTIKKAKLEDDALTLKRSSQTPLAEELREADKNCARHHLVSPTD